MQINDRTNTDVTDTPIILPMRPSDEDMTMAKAEEAFARPVGPLVKPSECPHETFRANVKVGRLSHDEGGPITGYTMDATVNCAVCGLPFRFLGIAAGDHYAEPRVSVDGIELRAPIEPATP